MAEYPSLYYSERERKEWEDQYKAQSKKYEDYTQEQYSLPQYSLATEAVSLTAKHKLTMGDVRGHVVKMVVEALQDVGYIQCHTISCFKVILVYTFSGKKFSEKIQH